MSDPNAHPRLSVHDAVRHYVDVLEQRVTRNEISEQTRAIYTRDLTEFVHLLGADTLLDDITTEHLHTALTSIANAPDKRFTRNNKLDHDGTTAPGRSHHAQTRWVAAVRGLFRWATEQGHVQADPTTGIKPPRTPKQARDMLRTTTAH